MLITVLEDLCERVGFLEGAAGKSTYFLPGPKFPDVDPNLGEISVVPSDGDTAVQKTTTDTYEFWVYDEGVWSRSFLIDIGSLETGSFNITSGTAADDVSGGSTAISPGDTLHLWSAGGIQITTDANGKINLELADPSTIAGSKTYDPGVLGDGVGESTTIAVAGAEVGDYAIASFSEPMLGILLDAEVSAADVVTVRFQNESGGMVDLASGTLRALVIKGDSVPQPTKLIVKATGDSVANSDEITVNLTAQQVIDGYTTTDFVGAPWFAKLSATAGNPMLAYEDEDQRTATAWVFKLSSNSKENSGHRITVSLQ